MQTTLAGEFNLAWTILLIRAERNLESDIHKIRAAIMYQTPYTEVTPVQRTQAKALNFFFIYGAYQPAKIVLTKEAEDAEAGHFLHAPRGLRSPR